MLTVYVHIEILSKTFKIRTYLCFSRQLHLMLHIQSNIFCLQYTNFVSARISIEASLPL